jgi:glutamine---fructose-6-phosphate transaminase (isomerizing)
VFSFSIVNKVESTIAKMTKCGVFCNAGREHSVASTKAFTCQVLTLAMIAVWFSELKNPSKKIIERNCLIEDIKMFPMKMQKCLNEVPKQCKEVA